jgi:hypothetical protein
MSKLERLVGRRLRPLPVGRPRKTKKKVKDSTKAKTSEKKRRGNRWALATFMKL